MLTESYWAKDTTEALFEMSVGDLLRDAADAAPERTALVDTSGSGRRWTYEALLADAEGGARALLQRFEPGDRLAVWGPNTPDWVMVELAAGLAGLILVTVNPAYKAAELAYVLQQSKAAGIIYTTEFRGNPMKQNLLQVLPDLAELRYPISFEEWSELVQEGSAADGSKAALPAVRADDPAQLQYTSGTTGSPKGALLPHRGIVNNARFTRERLEVAEGAAWLNPMPLFHTGGCVLGVLGALSARAVQVPVSFDPGLCLKMIEQERVEAMCAVPTMLIAMLEHPDFRSRDLSSLRVVVSGGAPVPAELVQRIEATLGVRFAIVFGQTEAAPVMTQTRLDDTPDDKSQTVGQAHPHQEIKIVDTEGGIVPCGVLGEVCGRGYNVMLGYYEMADATSEAIDAEGWLHTGDLGTMDERGYVRIEGRLKDMVIRGGENLYPREIEAVLFSHPAVSDAAVLGLPDDYWGEILAAAVRTQAGCQVSAEELRQYVRERLAPQKAPTRWAFVDEFPLTPSGKVQKFVLRERFVKGTL